MLNDKNNNFLARIKLKPKEIEFFNSQIKRAREFFPKRFNGDLPIKSIVQNLSQRDILKYFYPESAKLRFYSGLSDDEINLLRNSLHFRGRVDQIPELENFSSYIYIGGRGVGKTESGSLVLVWMHQYGNVKVSGVVGRTMREVKDVTVKKIIELSPPSFKPLLRGNKLVWPDAGVTYLYSAEEPDSIRGANLEFALLDEISSWRYPDAYAQLGLALRGGDNPRKMVLSTPKNNELTKEVLGEYGAVVQRNSTFLNRALPEKFIQQVLTKYPPGSFHFRQEVMAELVEDNLDALFTQGEIDSTRVSSIETYEEVLPSGIIEVRKRFVSRKFKKVIIGADPATTSEESSDETGIVVWGIGRDDQHYIIHSEERKEKPLEWCRQVVKLYHRYSARKVIVETNQGGDAWKAIIQTIDPTVLVEGYHSRQDKLTRLQPASALMKMGVLHFIDNHPTLESEITSYDGTGDSPNQLDAMSLCAIEATKELSMLDVFTDAGNRALDTQTIINNLNEKEKLKALDERKLSVEERRKQALIDARK